MRHLMAKADSVTESMTTGIGTLSFPHVFASTASIKRDSAGNPTGEKSYDIQIIIPKTQREDLRAILLAIKKVGEAKWGDNWKKMRQPLRDGDKEAGELTEDGTTTKGEKYPERAGCYFLNARSTRPVGVFDRQRNPITDSNDLYGGCKGKIAVQFYAYSKNGNHGIGVGLQGVQKIADGEAFGGSAPAVESMFDMLDDEDVADLDLDGNDVAEPEPEVAKPAAKKAAAKKTAAKKAAAKPEPEPEPVDDDLADLTGGADADEDDLFDDLDAE